MKEVRLGWLAGIIDGEGSIGMSHSKVKGTSYRPYIQICNCDLKLINEVMDILDNYKIKYTFYHRKEDRKSNWRDSITITIGTYSEGIKVLELMCPFLISKLEQASILLEFLRHRAGINHKGQVDSKGRFKKSYDGKEIEAHQKLHKLNFKGRR